VDWIIAFLRKRIGDESSVVNFMFPPIDLSRSNVWAIHGMEDRHISLWAKAPADGMAEAKRSAC
jgi:hypothetical protein